MAQYDGSVLINTKINVKNAEIQLSSLENRMSKTADKISDLRAKMDALEKTKTPTPEYGALDRELSKLGAEFEKIAEKQSRFLATGGKEGSSTYKRMEYDLDNLDRKQDEVISKMKELKASGKAFNLGIDSQKYVDYARQLQYAQNDLSVMTEKHEILNQKIESSKSGYVSLGSSIRNAFGMTGKALKDIPILALKSGVNGLISSFKKLGNVALSVAKGPFKLLGNIAKGAFSKIVKSTTSANKSFGLSFKNILKYGFGIRSLYALFNKLRSAIKEGYQNLYNDNERFKNSVDSLKASATTLKNSFAAAFRPLVDIAIPYIQKVMDYMSGLLDSVGQFLAAITGQKMYTKAIKQTTAALKEEKKAAEGYLSPLDEINKYQTNKDSGADAGTGGTMFQELPISDKFKDLAQWFKDMWAAADFTELGALIGEKLKNALDNIPWDQIKEVARKIGSSIATFINGFIEVEDLGYSIGRTLAEAVNTGFEFLNEFVHKLHWDSIGHFIADSLNGIFQNIDWPLIYDTFVTGAKGLGDAINSFVDDLDWGAIADSVSNFVNTFVDTVYEFVTTIDWKKLGEKVGKTLSDAWMGIDWKKAGETLGEVFIAFFDFISKAIENVDWKSVGETVKEFLVAIDWAGVSSAVFEAIGAAFGGIGAFIAGLFGDGITNGTISEYFAEKIREAGGNIVKGIYNGIVEGLSNIGDWIYENILKPFLDGFKAAFGIHSPSTVMEEQGTFIMQGLLNGISSLVDSVKEIWQSMKETAIEIWNSVKEKLSGIMDDVKSNISSKLDSIKSSWSSAWEGMKSTVVSIIESVKSAISSAFDWISDKVNDIADKISSIGKKSSITGGAGSRFLSSSFSSNKYLRSAPSPAFASLADVPIPAYANGQVIPRTMKQHLAVLGDNTRETEVVSPLSTIKQAVAEAMIEMGAGNGNTYKITAQANRSALFDIIIEEGKLRQMSTGKDPFSFT